MLNMPPATATDIAMVAGEASGDLLASLLLGGLNRYRPGLTVHGIGGPNMIAQGFRADWPMEKLAVRGYVEVLRHYREITGIRRALRSRLLAQRPAMFIGVDAPDFNLDLETGLKQAGIRTLHFVGPSIWAWRGKRIERIGAAVDHMLVLFPFEAELYRRAGIAATYVGHPLADVVPMQIDRDAARATLGLGRNDEVVALLPGSRLSEIRYIAPLFVAAARRMLAQSPHLKFIAPMAGAAAQAAFEACLLGADAPPITLLPGQSHAALAACNATLVASGTATLEAALFKRPMVIAYRMAPLSWFLMKRMKYQPWVGLPNILAQEFLVPEFLQDAATAEALATATLQQLHDDGNRIRLEARFTQMHAELRQDTALRGAAVIGALLDGVPLAEVLS
jgi:lipid-A-disaccharide synthase